MCKAYTEILSKAKIIKSSDNKLVQDSLKKIENELNKGELNFLDDFEDIHMNIEMMLKTKLGNLSGKIHTGKSRNDQVATDMKL